MAPGFDAEPITPISRALDAAVGARPPRAGGQSTLLPAPCGTNGPMISGHRHPGRGVDEAKLWLESLRRRLPITACAQNSTRSPPFN